MPRAALRLGVLLFAFTLTACAGNAGKATPPQPQPVAPAPQVGTSPTAAATPPLQTSVMRDTLDNGLRVVVVRNALAPVVTSEINYLVGSNEAPQGFPGTAHALEHMMFRGSPGLSRDQLSEISAQLGGDFNADTMQTATQYFFTTPAADLDVVLHIEALRMQGLDVTPADWAKERGAIEQEVSRDLSNPQYVFYSRLLAAMFKGTPYAHDALGTRPSFNKTSAAMLKSFHQKWYAPNNAILVVVGDVDPAATIQRVRDLFGSIPRQKLPPRRPVKLQPVQAKTLRLPTDQPYGQAVIAFRMPGYRSPDYAAATLLADVLDSRRGQLYALVPEGKALYAGFDAEGMPDTALGFALGVFPKGADADALLKTVGQRVAEVRKSGVSPALVEAARRQEIAQLERQKNSVPGLANAWSTALALQGLDSPDAMKAAFESVTVADVNRVARQVLDPAQAVSAILTPEPSGKPVAGKGFGGAESFSAVPSKPVQLPDWAQQGLSRLVVPQQTLHPLDTVLPNGLRLIVQPDEVSDTVSVYGSVHNHPELQEPKGKEGVGGVLDQLFGYGGGSLDRVAFQSALDDIAAIENPGTHFSVQAPAANFERAVQLLADNELQPQLPPDAFRIVRTQLAQAVAGQLQSPGYLFGRAIDKALLPENDPGLRQATPQTVSSLTLNDVRDYYRSVFRPDLTTIVVIGKIAPGEAQRVVARYFGDWKAQGPKPDLTLPRVPVNSTPQALVPDRTSVQDSVALAQNVGVHLHDADHYALQLGNQVLGQGFYASRLYRDLRARTGLVYSVGSDFDFGLTRSSYTVRYGCDPDKVDRARAIVVSDLKQMQEAPISDAELSRAKAMLLRRIPLQNDAVGHIANAWLYYIEHELPLDQPTVAARHYAALDAQQVQAAYRQWLRPDGFAQVVKGPAPK
jgi:zinc protease